jgi:hypothetical protein
MADDLTVSFGANIGSLVSGMQGPPRRLPRASRRSINNSNRLRKMAPMRSIKSPARWGNSSVFSDQPQISLSLPWAALLGDVLKERN